VVWGPLMVGGTYYAATGSIPWQVWLASLPYALLCTAVLMGKHVDKLPWDSAEGVRTLPVILGERQARRLTQVLVVGFYAATAMCVAAGALPWPVVAVLGAVPLAVRGLPTLGRPRPAEPPRDFPVWPLWYAAVAFVHTRRAGALLVAGLAVAVAFDIRPF
jgi:1,4-dihydroxy-2-naphthoate polyprenyltransferase